MADIYIQKKNNKKIKQHSERKAFAFFEVVIANYVNMAYTNGAKMSIYLHKFWHL